MGKAEEALARIEAQRGEDAGINEVCDFLSAWVKAEGDAAALVLAKEKTAKGAFAALKAYARKHQKGGYYRYEEKLAFSKIMAYYGVAEEEADARLEHGLFYEVMAAKLEKWRPYGKETVWATQAAPPKKAPPAGLSLSLSDLGL
ncbi:MAG: hypothetical protein ACTTJE_04965 [Schwartzia sp. (in: firmicutes)]